MSFYSSNNYSVNYFCGLDNYRRLINDPSSGVASRTC